MLAEEKEELLVLAKWEWRWLLRGWREGEAAGEFELREREMAALLRDGEFAGDWEAEEIGEREIVESLRRFSLEGLSPPPYQGFKNIFIVVFHNRCYRWTTGRWSEEERGTNMNTLNTSDNEIKTFNMKNYLKKI